VVVDVSDSQAPAEKTTQPAPDLVTVEIGSDTPAADGAGQTELEAELIKLEKQVQDLRARLAKAQRAATATRRPKTPEATVEAVPATGKLWSRRRLLETEAPKDELPRLPAEGHAAGTVGAPAAGGETNAATPAAARQPAAEAAVGGLHLDLVRLAEAYADAVGGVEIARARLEQAQAAAQEANVGAAARAEVKVQEITVRTAQRKLTTLRRIAEVVTGTAEQEANSTDEEIKHVKQLYERGYVSESHVRDAMRRYQSVQANLKTLRSILSE
jgi:hypothetical protein